MTTNLTTKIATQRYGIEFFHIYTDETINEIHKGSLNYLRSARQAWNFPHDLIILIDNYNPTEHVLTESDVFKFLEAENLEPRYWAYEGDMLENAKILLENITNAKLKKQYTKYIEDKGKFPCSLLTAAWYLTRLGKLDVSMIRSTSGETYQIPERLINILPYAYKEVENRAREIIHKSTYSDDADRIQDLFYPAGSHRKIDLF